MTLFVLAGPTGTGKTTIFNYFRGLDRDDLDCVITCTSRHPRPTEMDGRDFHFMNPGALKDMEHRGELLEFAINHGNEYGTPNTFVDPARDTLIIFDIGAGIRVREKMPTVIIFLEPDNMTDVVRRLKKRGSSNEEITRRLKTAEKELRMKHRADYIVPSVEGELVRMQDDVTAIVQAERLKRSRHGIQQGAAAP